MNHEYCIKCNECLNSEDNLCSVTNVEDLWKLLKDIYRMSISWCAHVGDVKSLLGILCSKLHECHGCQNYNFINQELKLIITNLNYKKSFSYAGFGFHVNYIINNQETLKEMLNLLSQSYNNNLFELFDVNTNNKINFSFENLNNYIGKPLKISTVISSIADILILSKKLVLTTETGTNIFVNEIIGSGEYDSIPDESIISIYTKCSVDKLSLKLSKTHELQTTSEFFHYYAQKLPTKTKPAIH